MENLKKNLLKLNLQNFSENPGKEPENEPGDDPDKTEGKEPRGDGDAKFTQEQQDQINRLIAQAKSKAKSEAEKNQEKIIEERIKTALKEEKDYAKMSEDEKERKRFENDRKKFEKEREEFEYSKLMVSVSQDLLDKGLPSEFAEFVTVKGDSEKSLENVGVLKDKFDTAVAAAAKELVKQPGVSDGQGSINAKSLGAQLAQGVKNTGKIFE